MMSVIMSTIVVIIGPAMRAGSSFMSFAMIGSVQPMSFATITAQNIASDTTKNICNVPSQNRYIRRIFTAPSAVPQRTATRSSLNTILK